MHDLAERLKRALGPSYELGPLLGRGGMGAVYQARDRRLSRSVAVKVLPPTIDHPADYRARFLREAQTVAGLSHPNIVPIFDVGDQHGLVWFVMALVEGESVRAKVQRLGPLTIGVIGRLFQEVAQALAYSHARGIVHRDINPGNILIEQHSERAMVTDFGIARMLRLEDTTLTQTGTIIGTPRYMAPEQLLRPESVDGRADMYSLALVVFFMMAATDAIKETSLTEIIAAHVRGVAVDLAEVERRVPAPLAGCIVQCLAPAPGDRYLRMESVVAALREFSEDSPVVSVPIQMLFRETERALLASSLMMVGLGWVGVGHVPPTFIVLVLGGLIMQWVIAHEHATHRGVTWPMVRQAVYLERSRRVDQIHEWSVVGWGTCTIAALVVWSLVFVVVSRSAAGRVASSFVDFALLATGVIGGIKVVNTFGLRRIRSSLLRLDALSLMLSLLLTLLGAVLFVMVSDPHKQPLRTIMGIAVLLGITFAGFFGGRFQEHEWRIPRWLDLLGSLFFGRVARHGLRLRFQRDKGPKAQ